MYFWDTYYDDFENFCIHHDIDYSIAYNELNYYPRGYVFKKNNGKYHIVLNGKHDINQLKKTVIHELTHILNNDLDKPKKMKNICEEETEYIVNTLNSILTRQ